MAMHQITPQGAKLAALDPIWDRVRGEAEDIVRREPELASFIYSTVLHHDRLEDAVIHRIAERLDHQALSGDLIRQTYDEALRDEPDLDIAENLGARSNHHAAADFRMAILILLPGAAERDAVQDRDVVVDHRGLADHKAGRMIEENAAADFGGGVDVGLKHRRRAALQIISEILAASVP